VTDYPLTPQASSSRSHLSPISVSIDLDALSHNFLSIRSQVLPQTRILAIIKADGYGHGAVPIAKTLHSLGVFGFGVASVHEGVTLRENGILDPILVMGPLQTAHLKDLCHYTLTPVISHHALLDDLIALLPKNLPPYPIHIKVDTGLHRLGMNPEDVLAIFHFINQPRCPVTVTGFMTHFADADNPDGIVTNHQLAQFRSLTEQLQTAGFSLPLLHLANSAGILFHKEAHLDMVRPGLMLYGYAPSHPGQPPPIRLKPVLAASTYIAHLRLLQPGEIVGYNAQFRTKRSSKIAVLPVGYTHGIPRKLTGIGHVLIQGELAPIIGKICMDMMMVDVTEIPHPAIGQEVRLIGIQGTRSISAEDYATWLETIPYEVLCGIGGKARKTYHSAKVHLTNPDKPNTTEYP